MTRDQLLTAIKLIEPRYGEGYRVRVWFNGFSVRGTINSPTPTLLVINEDTGKEVIDVAISIDAIDAIARIT